MIGVTHEKGAKVEQVVIRTKKPEQLREQIKETIRKQMELYFDDK